MISYKFIKVLDQVSKKTKVVNSSTDILLGFSCFPGEDISCCAKNTFASSRADLNTLIFLVLKFQKKYKT